MFYAVPVPNQFQYIGQGRQSRTFICVLSDVLEQMTSLGLLYYRPTTCYIDID